MSDSDDYDLLPDDVEDNLSTAGSNFFDCLVRNDKFQILGIIYILIFSDCSRSKLDMSIISGSYGEIRFPAN